MSVFTTFETVCMKCSKKLKLVSWNCQIGMNYFALCPKHLKAFMNVSEDYLEDKFDIV